jgi:hypothetical protein
MDALHGGDRRESPATTCEFGSKNVVAKLMNKTQACTCV